MVVNENHAVAWIKTGQIRFLDGIEPLNGEERKLYLHPIDAEELKTEVELWKQGYESQMKEISKLKNEIAGLKTLVYSK
jgi:hypothetical protein